MNFKKKLVSIFMSFMVAFTPILCVSADTEPSLMQQTVQTTDQKGTGEGSVFWYLAMQAAKIGIAVNAIGIGNEFAAGGLLAAVLVPTIKSDIITCLGIGSAVSGIVIYTLGVLLLLDGLINIYRSLV